MKKEIKIHVETSENKTTPNWWDSVKAVLREVHQNASLPQETRKTSNKQPNLTPKATRKRTKNLKVSRKNEIRKIRAEINDTEMQTTIAKINKTKSWFFEKISKTDKPLARLIKKKRDKTEINKIRNEKGEVTTDNTELQGTIRD